MSMSQANQVKFGILAIPNFQTFPKRSVLPFDLSEGVIVTLGPLKDSLKAETIKHWEKWLGSIEWESIEKRRVYLQVIHDPNSSDQTYSDDRNIQRALHDAYLSLMVCAPLRAQSDSALLMIGSGSFESGKVAAEVINTSSRYQGWIESHYMYSRGYHGKKAAYLRAPALFDEWKKIFEQLRKFNKRKRGKEALALAIESFRNGLEVQFLDFRIPYFIRTCEAITAPKKNETKAKFVSRCMTLLKQPPLPLFLSRKTDTQKLLEDLFEIRNGAVHGMPFGWKIPKRVKSKRRMDQYAFLAEECARRAIKFALDNDAWIKASGNRTQLEDWCSANW